MAKFTGQPMWAAPPILNGPPNILLIIVDQMRLSRWLSAAQTQAFQAMLPNICGKLQNNSYVFSNYYTAATACTAARGTLLTGLYAPQTALYVETGAPGTSVNVLNSAYPTWGLGIQTVNPAYQGNLWWFGKWHLSTCNNLTPLAPFGFQTRTYPGGLGPIPNPSPDGFANEGVNGGPYQNYVLASDADIAGDFAGWLAGQQPTRNLPVSPWCATVSLINPHDIASAPAFPTTWFPKDQFPPPSNVPALYDGLPSPWNYENLATVTNKPSLQYAYQAALNATSQPVVYPHGWVEFLNHYYWLHNYVDTVIGSVLDALAASPYAANTVIVFCSDHGEYAGSHGLHDKAYAVYDESINVPLSVQFPGQTQAYQMGQMCSSVDMFGLMCDLASGGAGQWRTVYPDLAARQSIWDFLYQNAAESRVIPSGNLAGMPFIFHTSDETTTVPPGTPNSHVVGLRTSSSKLGVYSTWAPCTTIPNGSPQEFEFYNLIQNPGELGNGYSTASATVQSYLAALGAWPSNGLIGAELNRPLVGLGTNGQPLSAALAAAQQSYFRVMGQS